MSTDRLHLHVIIPGEFRCGTNITNSVKTFVWRLNRLLCLFQPAKDDLLNLNAMMLTSAASHGVGSLLSLMTIFCTIWWMQIFES